MAGASVAGASVAGASVAAGSVLAQAAKPITMVRTSSIAINFFIVILLFHVSLEWLFLGTVSLYTVFFRNQCFFFTFPANTYPPMPSQHRHSPASSSLDSLGMGPKLRFVLTVWI